MQTNGSAYRELLALQFNKRASLLQGKQQPAVSGFGAEGKDRALPQSHNEAALIFTLIIHYC